MLQCILVMRFHHLLNIVVGYVCRVGKYISTKKPLTEREREDVTHEYKYQEGEISSQLSIF